MISRIQGSHGPTRHLRQAGPIAVLPCRLYIRTPSQVTPPFCRASFPHLH